LILVVVVAAVVGLCFRQSCGGGDLCLDFGPVDVDDHGEAIFGVVGCLDLDLDLDLDLVLVVDDGLVENDRLLL